MCIQFLIEYNQDGLLAELKILWSVVVGWKLSDELHRSFFEASKNKMWSIIFFLKLFI